MLTWMKKLLAGGAMALAIGATGVIVTSPAYAADEVKKPAVTAPAATPAAAEPAVPEAQGQQQQRFSSVINLLAY